MDAAARAFVIGHPIRHSRSPLLHGYWLQELGLPGAYERVDVPPAELAAFAAGFRAAGFVGGNVTIPHKQAVMAALDHITPEARAIGAVNTIWLEAGGTVGGNTDAHGFLANLDEAAPGWDGPALVLGAGGAARAVTYALLQRGHRVMVTNRTGATAEALAAAFGPGVTGGDWSHVAGWMQQAALLVNASSLGMAGAPPLDLPLDGLPQAAVVYDIVYTPLMTPLLQRAAARGHPVVDGLGMLLHQAVPGFSCWFGRTPVVSPGLRAHLLASLAG